MGPGREGAGHRKKRARRQYRSDADLAEFYGFWPGGLSDEERWGLEENMPRLQARRDLRMYRYAGREMSTEMLHDLVLRETESKEQAEAVTVSYLWAMLRGGQKPEI